MVAGGFPACKIHMKVDCLQERSALVDESTKFAQSAADWPCHKTGPVWRVILLD